MSMQDLIDAIRIVESKPEKAFFAGERSEALVRAAEIRLGVIFPPTYRRFLLRLGAGNFGSAEFYGITTDNFESAAVPNGIWFTLVERKEIGLPPNLVAIGLTGYDEIYCVDTSTTPDGPVIIYRPQSDSVEQKAEIATKDFGAFF